MQLVDLKFRPGVDKQDTAYSAGDQRKYVDSDFVRFHYGKPERHILGLVWMALDI